MQEFKIVAERLGSVEYPYIAFRVLKANEDA
jgi:hypothetical protein